MLPGVEHTGNSVVTALITSDPVKATALSEKYDVKATFTYEQFDEALSSGGFDAIYLATPNWRHAEFIVPALKAGIHVLTEKPLEISTEKCEEILEAEKNSSAKLMVAYRLHFEPATLNTIDKIRSGELGTVHLFSSNFAQMVDPANHRAHSGELAALFSIWGPILSTRPDTYLVMNRRKLCPPLRRSIQIQASIPISPIPWPSLCVFQASAWHNSTCPILETRPIRCSLWEQEEVSC